MRGELLGTLPAIGFAVPTCRGPTCAFINATVTDDKYAFNRDAYLDNEAAIISCSGPALVNISRLDTEASYDILKVGSQKLSGYADQAVEVPLPAGPAAITWMSDTSIVAQGWTLDIVQGESKAEFELASLPASARRVEIVAAYHDTELAEGI